MGFFGKAGIILVFMVLVMALPAFAAHPEATQFTYSPSPAVPGSTITVFVQIENKDLLPQTGVSVRLNDSYPFTAKSAAVEIGDMDRYGKASAQFTVYIDPNAENASYDLTVVISSSSNAGEKSTAFPVAVSGKEPTIRIVSSTPEELMPGEEKQISLTLQNVGTSSAYDVIVEIQEDRTVTSTGTVVEREITPLGAAATYVGEIRAGEKQMALLKVGANSEAELKNYILPLEISYRNSSGTRTTETSYIGLKVGGEVQLDAALKETSIPYIAGTKGEVVVELFNKGNAKAEFVIVEATTDSGTVEKQKQFIGSLEPNDIDSFKTGVVFDSGLETGSSTIDVKVTYQDADATTKTIEMKVPIMVYSAADGAAMAGGGANPLLLALVLIVIVVLGWQIRKRLRKKK